MICGLSCGFVGRGGGRLLDRGAPALTVTAPCIWHGCGTNLNRRQSATTAARLNRRPRVSLHPHRPSPRCQCRRPERATTADPYWWCLSPQLGKLRAFGAGRAAELGVRPTLSLIAPGRFHRGFPLFPALSGALVVRRLCPGLVPSATRYRSARRRSLAASKRGP